MKVEKSEVRKHLADDEQLPNGIYRKDFFEFLIKN